jgi:hypothetical protein
LFTTYYNILFHPGNATKGDMKIVDSFKLYYSLTILPIVVYVVIGLLFIGSAAQNSQLNSLVQFASGIYYLFTGNYNYGGISLGSNAYAAVAYSAMFYLWVWYPLLILIYSLILHGVWKNLVNKLKQPFANTIAAVMYSQIPYVSFIWLLMLPVFSSGALTLLYDAVIAGWSIALFVIALSGQQRISRQDSFYIFFATAVVAIVFLLIIFFALFSGGLGVFGGGGLG